MVIRSPSRVPFLKEEVPCAPCRPRTCSFSGRVPPFSSRRSAAVATILPPAGRGAAADPADRADREQRAAATPAAQGAPEARLEVPAVQGVAADRAVARRTAASLAEPPSVRLPPSAWRAAPPTTPAAFSSG